MAVKQVQQMLFEGAAAASANGVDTSSSFVDNMSLPVHRWYRFSAGFSATWVESVIAASRHAAEARVFDPFAGSGTTLLAAESVGAQGLGIEAHPFVYRVARAKLCRRADPEEYVQLIRKIRKASDLISPALDHYPELIHKCFPAELLATLDALRRAVEAERDESEEWLLAWLTLAGILRMSSPVGTAQWQYVLPRKEKKRSLDPHDALALLSRMIAADMRLSREQVTGPQAQILQGDARTCVGVPDGFANLVVTSPPYPNNYDYADATRLEMCFFGEIAGWGDLQEKVRSRLVRSCSQHVPPKAIDLTSILASPELMPIRDEIVPICERLSEVRLTKGGKKTYHLMVACYFHDLAQVWQALRRVCDPDGQVCFVVGDSAPYGVYVPVMEWLGKLAVAAGFSTYRFEKTRDRNVKWKNRKHRVPLCEGRLWVDG